MPGLRTVSIPWGGFAFFNAETQSRNEKTHLFTAEPAENAENLEFTTRRMPSFRALTLKLIGKPTLQPESFR